MTSFYFGYGSNLNLEDWKDFTKKHNLRQDTIEAIPGIFFLPDHELEFHTYSPSRNGGVLDVIPKLGHAVAGKLFKVKDNFEALDIKEGYPNFYQRIEVTILDEKGDQHKAITYRVCPENVKDFLKPAKKYLDIILKGYEDFEISKKYPWAKSQLLLSAKQKIDSSGVQHVFVYGTLCKGQSREKNILKFSKKIQNDQKIHGSLVDCGDYPGLLQSSKTVYGEIHYTPLISETLESLDSIEGFYGYDIKSLFYRILFQSGTTTCWTYLLNNKNNLKQIIDSGNWLLYSNRKKLDSKIIKKLAKKKLKKIQLNEIRERGNHKSV